MSISEFSKDTQQETIPNHINDNKEFNLIERIYVKVEPTDVEIKVIIYFLFI